MKTGKIIDIECQCGYKLFRYFKAGKGRIIKCYINRMEADYVGLKGTATHTKPLCPECGKELGIIMMIHGVKDIRI
jgi:hypothetical protein